MHPFSLRTALAAAAAVLLALPAGAAASPSVEIGLADENVLKGQIDGQPVPGGTDAVVAQWKAHGVQDVRIFAKWDDFAPKPDDTKMPAGFVGDDPAAYDLSALDRRIDAVVKHDLNVTLVITGPGPVWGSIEPARLNRAWKPSPKLFGDFATAIAKHVGARVNRYIVWNEPNQKSWLQPQNSCVVAKNGITNICSPVAPHLYRELAQAGYSAINAADPKARVAVGATSSTGLRLAKSTNSTTQPLPFLRTMACVSSRYRPIKSGECKDFKAVTGDALAYHPHSKRLMPGERDPDKNNARMGDLDRLTGVIDKLTAKKRLKVAHAKKLPLWLDEYGFETNPPDEQGDGTVAPKKAAAWVQWAGAIAARNPRVETLTQYEWFDEPTGDDGQQFNRWQSGLYTVTGKPKPLAAVFAHPIFGWRTGNRGFVWGQVRPGEGATKVRLQRKSGKSYKAYKTVKTDRYGTFQVRVPASASHRYRFVYVDPTTGADATSGTTTLREQ
ncbi:hypothetical protein [Patulibacter americanus]|uniref:hypothetical protein n=1 Tax=Patulibacter americanus TaxID=588672 RepID=UPI0003B76532|nr:hypothetical protein [Patulibacter americanus]